MMHCQSKPFRTVPFLAALLSAACGGSREPPKTAAGDSLSAAMEHEPCDTNSSSAERTDANGDGKPDIIRVLSGGRETCRLVELNHDERPESFLYFDPDGTVRRRESDYDRDGRIDEIALFKKGVLVRKDRETTLDGRADTWDFYEGGRLHHRLRDSNGDGKVDQWWSWPNADRAECAVIASDANGDGQPDPSEVVDTCAVAQGHGPAAPGATATAPASSAAPPPTASPAAGSASPQASASPTVDGGPSSAATTSATGAAPASDGGASVGRGDGGSHAGAASTPKAKEPAK